MNGVTVEVAMTYMRRFGTFLVYIATVKKINRESTVTVSFVVFEG